MTANKIISKENIFLNEKYYHIKHGSGLNIYVSPKNLTTFYAVFGTKYGSIDNKFKLAADNDYTVVPDGIAHFLEHKMFENEDGEDTFLKFAETGASANAYTSFNSTVYLYSCTSKFYESLEILLEFVTHPYFTPETVEKEQGIIAQEIKMGEDNPGRTIIFDILQSMYKDHNVRIEIAGTVKSISEITADILYKCYNTFYNLNNMALCVCGNIECEKVIEIADKALANAPDVKIESVYSEEEPEVFRKSFSRKMQVAKPLFNIGIKDIEISGDINERFKKAAAISILTTALFGKSGELYNDLYESGLISPSFDVWFEHNQAYSFILLSGDSDKPEEVFNKFKEYIDKIKSISIGVSDFERSKRVLYANMVKSFDSTEDIANNFLSYIFEGSDIFNFIDIINSVDYNYTSELLLKMFKDDYYSISVIYPFDQ